MTDTDLAVLAALRRDHRRWRFQLAGEQRPVWIASRVKAVDPDLTAAATRLEADTAELLRDLLKDAEATDRRVADER